jgi:hypothetical protein
VHELDRRSMLKVVAALSLGPYPALADEKESTLHFVEAGTDRTGQPHKAARANSHLDFKVLTHGEGSEVSKYSGLKMRSSMVPVVSIGFQA